jgi:sulfur-oxidizing protein SoxY
MSAPILLIYLLLASLDALATDEPTPTRSPVDVWESLIRPHHFKDVAISEDEQVVKLVAPYRAEDAAFTPIRVQAMVPQTAARYIATIHLIVDDNPEPLAGSFHFTPASGSADLALRLRIDKYTHVRAVAVMNTGEHYMAKRFVKAQGGCAIPLNIDYRAAMADLGRMQLRTVGKRDPTQALATQLAVHHPNFSGMQMDYKIYAVRPAHYVKHIDVFLDDQPVLRAETGIAISTDPSFRFFLRPGASGVLRAEIADSKGNNWSEQLEL